MPQLQRGSHLSCFFRTHLQSGQGRVRHCLFVQPFVLLSVQKRVSRIGKIFVTHLHGDHALGIPSLLSQVAAAPPASRAVRSAERCATASPHTRIRVPHSPEFSSTSDSRSRACPSAPASEIEAQAPNTADLLVSSKTVDKAVQEAHITGLQQREGIEDHQEGGMAGPVVDIFGPEGLRSLLRALFVVSLSLSD